MVRQNVGLFLLAVPGALGAWSATNTSWTGHCAFGMANPRAARFSMNTGLAIISALAAGVYLLYGKRGEAAAIATAITGAGLYLLYDTALPDSYVKGVFASLGVSFKPLPGTGASDRPKAWVSR